MRAVSAFGRWRQGRKLGALALVLGLSWAAAGTVRAPGQGPADGTELLVRVREGDSAGVEAALAVGADPDTRDATGATALMHAAAFASPETMSALLDAGADVNAVNESGATALMWATHDAARVRLLLDAGAEVDAGGPDGVTALVSAALRGNADAMRVLIEAGADPESGSVMAPWRMDLAGIAATTNDPAIAEVLGIGRDAAREQVPTVPPPFTRWVLTRTFSWRPQPLPTDAGVVRELLDQGADPNEIVSQLTLAVPVLSRVAATGDVEAARVLLERGADPNLAGSRGLTPLIIAAATDRNDAVVALLLEAGAAVDSRDENGRAALDWALMRGETETSRLLGEAGAIGRAPGMPPVVSVSSRRGVREAVERALARLQPSGPAFHQRSGCISCHNQSLPAVAVKLAADGGIAVDRALARRPTEATLGVWEASREDLMVGNCSIFGFLPNVTYGLFALAEEGVPPNSVTDAVVFCLSGLQRADGSWEGGDIRLPLSGRNPIVYTALAARGLMEYSPPGRGPETDARLGRALAYLLRAAPGGTQDEAFRLMGLAWLGAPEQEIRDQAARLLALQRPDGGWGQMPTMPPDAYATGQAVYALRASGIAVPDGDAYGRATEYLLRTQLEDGTWQVRSRTVGFQPYVEAGFPHGADQFISAAATSWAVMALAAPY